LALQEPQAPIDAFDRQVRTSRLSIGTQATKKADAVDDDPSESHKEPVGTVHSFWHRLQCGDPSGLLRHLVDNKAHSDGDKNDWGNAVDVALNFGLGGATNGLLSLCSIESNMVCIFPAFFGTLLRRDPVIAKNGLEVADSPKLSFLRASLIKEQRGSL
jgi:hypothetical protein